MSFFDVLEPRHSQKEALAMTAVQPTSNADVYHAQKEDFRRRERTDSAFFNMKDELNKRYELYEQIATGRKGKTGIPRLLEDASKDFPEIKQQYELSQLAPDPFGFSRGDNEVFATDIQNKIDQYILKLRDQDSEKYKDILTQDEINTVIENKNKAAKEHKEKMYAGAEGGLMTFLAGAGGALAEGITEPLNVIGALVPTPKKFQQAGLLGKIGFDALVDAGTEVVIHPIVADYNRKMGIKYGIPDLVGNVGGAIAGGLILRGGIAAVPPVFDIVGRAVPDSLAFRRIGERFRRVGDDVTANEFDTMGRSADRVETDLSVKGVVDSEANGRAFDELNASSRQDRAPDHSRLPDEARLLDEERIKNSGDETYKVEAAEAKRVKAEAAPAPEGKVRPEARQFVDDDPDGLDLIDDKGLAEQSKLARQPEVLEAKMNKLEEFSTKNPDIKYSDAEGKQMSFDELKERAESIDSIEQSLRTCGAI